MQNDIMNCQWFFYKVLNCFEQPKSQTPPESASVFPSYMLDLNWSLWWVKSSAAHFLLHAEGLQANTS